MDKEYIQRLKDMLADADAKIASVEDIQDPTEREVKKSMFLESRKEIEALLKKAGGSVKKPAAKKATTKKSTSSKKKTTKKPAAKKVSKAKTKKPVAKKATKKVTKKPAKKAAPKKPTAKKPAKKVTKKPAKKVAKKAAPKKAAKKPVSKKKPAAKKTTAKKSSKDVTVKQFTKKPKKTAAKKSAKVAKASTADDAKAVFSNESKKDLKNAKKSSVKEKKSSAKKAKQAKSTAKKSNASQKKVAKTTAKSKREAKADMNADANIYMKPKKNSNNSKVDNNVEAAAETFGTDKNDSKIIKKEDKTTAKQYKKAEKWEKKEAKLEAKEEKPLQETKATSTQKVSADDKAAIKEAKRKEKEAKKLAKKQAKEYKKQAKLAKKEIKKPVKVNGYEIPEYTDDIDKVRTRTVPQFGVSHPEMTEKELALNTEYAALFYADPDAQSNKDFADHKPISVGSYNDSNYEGAIQPYKDTKSTPTAKVGVEAGPLQNGPVAIADETATDASVNEKPAKPAKVSKKQVKVEKPVEPKPVEEKPVEEAKPVEDKKTTKAEKQQAKEAAKAAKEKEKQEKELAKQKAAEEKEAAKLAKEKEKEIKKVNAKAGDTVVKPKAAESAKTVDPKEAKKLAKKEAKEAKKQAKAQAKLAKKQQKEAMEREAEMKRKQEEDELKIARSKSVETAEKHKAESEKQKDKEAEINRLAAEASAKAAKQQKEDEAKEAKRAKSSKKSKKALAAEAQQEQDQAAAEDKRIAEQSSKRAEIKKGEFIKVDLPPIPDEGVKSLKQIAKRQKQLTSKYSKQILEGAIVTTTDYKPEVSKHVIELHDVVKSYITGDIETPVLKGVNLKLNKGDFIVILGPSGSGKTTFLNTISGLDKATKGDVFVLGYNLSYLKDSHLTKFRRKHVGFIFQQYNLLTNLTAKENAEVGENLSAYKNPDMTIEDIFETIGMKTQMNKYPHQMSGGQQQRVSIARALAKNPDILFADEPTGALDEEMGRKVLEILVEVNKRYGTTVIVVTHNPNIAKIGNTVIHIRNGKVEEVEANQKPEDPSTIEWA